MVFLKILGKFWKVSWIGIFHLKWVLRCVECNEYLCTATCYLCQR